MQTSAMKAGFQIAECSLSSAKRYKNNFFQKTDRCNYLEYSGDAVMVIYHVLRVGTAWMVVGIRVLPVLLLLLL